MSILCKLFGHQPPVYAQTGWYSPGEQYMQVEPHAVDGIGREHAIIKSKCPRCGTKFKVGLIHLPERESEKKLTGKYEDLKKLMNVGGGI